MWTHLQAPEDRANAASQVRAFEDATAALRAAAIRLPRRHLRASGALVVGSSPTEDPTAFDGTASYEGVRPGLSIYGLLPDELAGSPVAEPARRLRPVLSLRARPVRVQELPEGWGVSYGPTFRTSRPSRIATLPLGYGDGWARALSNRAEALVRGRRVPLVGNVAMDAVMADVTDVPGRDVTVEDAFTLIGRQGHQVITVGEIARSGGTNSWEIVTSMARRLPRVYHAASGPVSVRTLVSGGRG
jgi:alanine racemase